MASNLTKSFDLSITTNNKRAFKNDAIGNLTVEEFETAVMYFENKCAYSGKKFDNGAQISIEHIIPITSGGHSMAFNCVPVIQKYNTLKSSYHLLDWWQTYTANGAKILYTPYRLLKLINYMVKNLECIELENKRDFILTPDEVDKFLLHNKEKLNSDEINLFSDKAYNKINNIELLTAMDLLTVEDNYVLYSSLEGLKLNPAIFFEEALYVLQNDVPIEIINVLKNRINSIPNIYIDNKKVFKKEMNPEDIEIRAKVLKWAEKEKIENEFGIIGYIDFEILKKQDNLEAFLENRKQLILRTIGAKDADFNNIVNKIPNIITNLSLEKRVEDIEKSFGISRVKSEKKSSEMYRYLVNKPDLILTGKIMEIMLDYAQLFSIDKRLLKKGISLNTIVDNIEICIEILKNSGLRIDDKVRKRILEKFINNSNGKLIREAYKELKYRVRNKNKKLTREEVERDASKWLICISEKYNTSEIFNEKKISKAESLYKNMSFNEEGYMKGVNRNAYIVPKLIRISNLNISRQTESNIINDVFFVKRVKLGESVESIYDYLVERVREDNPTCDEEHVLQDAARWFVFLAENSQISLDVMFGTEREKYADITIKYYKDMKFDDEGNFINQFIPELSEKTNGFSIGEEYMKIINSFFNAKGDYYIIGKNKILKTDLQERLYREISKCKNKRGVKNVCIKIRKEYTGRGRRKNGQSR